MNYKNKEINQVNIKHNHIKENFVFNNYNEI
jgi:hypothetical protein